MWIKHIVVMTIGRRRLCEASRAASNTDTPCNWRSRANSTIRIAFLQARPTSTTNPICVKRLSCPRTKTPASALQLSFVEAGVDLKEDVVLADKTPLFEEDLHQVAADSRLNLH